MESRSKYYCRLCSEKLAIQGKVIVPEPYNFATEAIASSTLALKNPRTKENEELICLVIPVGHVVKDESGKVSAEFFHRPKKTTKQPVKETVNG